MMPTAPNNRNAESEIENKAFCSMISDMIKATARLASKDKMEALIGVKNRSPNRIKIALTPKHMALLRERTIPKIGPPEN